MKHESKKVKISHVSSKKPSTGHIRRNVRDSLEEILLKRCVNVIFGILPVKPVNSFSLELSTSCLYYVCNVKLFSAYPLISRLID